MSLIILLVLAILGFCAVISNLCASLLSHKYGKKKGDCVEHFRKNMTGQRIGMGQPLMYTMRVRIGQDERIPACENKCKSQQTQAESIIMFDPTAPVRPSTGAMVMCGEQNYNADVYIMTQIRKKIIDSAMETLQNQDDFVIFFTKQNYEGRMFLFSAHEDASWNMAPSKIDPENISYEKAMEQEEKDKKEEEEKNAPTFIDSKKHGEQKTHIDVKTFLDDFSFDMGRKYSCIIPESVEFLQIIPFDVTEKPSEGWTGLKLKSGKYPELTYNRARPAVFKIESKKTSAGWEQKTFQRNAGQQK